METYFNIRYEFDKKQVLNEIDLRLSKSGSDYICVADGVILNKVNIDKEYRDIVDGGLFSICDSSYVPLYIKWIYGKKYQQYCGSQIFKDVISSGRYRMIFLGTNKPILDGLKKNLEAYNSNITSMQFVELPFCDVKDFNYQKIAKMIQMDGAEIIWIALGAPKQEYFMSMLKPYLSHGIMIAVGAAFKFYSGVEVKRAPEWMIRNHLEFVYRLMNEPKKQFRRCYGIVSTLPKLLYKEWKISKTK